MCAGPECWCYDCCIDSVYTPTPENSDSDPPLDKATAYGNIKRKLFLNKPDLGDLEAEIKDLKTQIKQERERRKLTLRNHIQQISIFPTTPATESVQSHLRSKWIFDRLMSCREFDHTCQYVFHLDEEVKGDVYHFDECFFTLQPYIDATDGGKLKKFQDETEELGLQFWYQENTFHGHRAWLIIIAGPRLPLDVVIQWVLANKV
eukprot:TRINITY_DN6959_c0_g1_i1.p1 TRINITY_DN6959_c0_g1~~TRINITY_DN6959_c0_g1_i1.p1  ORF type:complete len:226 (-),score=44.91 TRINITY_DN6959_c0_g1_i1:4-618(-)